MGRSGWVVLVFGVLAGAGEARADHQVDTYPHRSFEGIGFSKDGQYFAVILREGLCVELDGVGEVCRPNAVELRLKVLDVRRSKVVESASYDGSPAEDSYGANAAYKDWEEGSSTDSTRTRALREFAPLLSRLEIDPSHLGVAEGYESSLYALGERDWTFGAAGDRFRIELVDTPGPEVNACDGATQLLHVQLVRLSDRHRQTVMKDPGLVGWRKCGEYSLQGYYVYKGKGPAAVGIVVSTGKKGWQLMATQVPATKK